MTQRFLVSLEQGLHIFIQPVKKIVIINTTILNYLGQTGIEFPLWQGIQYCRI